MNRPLKDLSYYIIDCATGQITEDQECQVIESKPLERHFNHLPNIKKSDFCK